MDKLHVLSIKQREPGRIATGANTVVELDGRPLNCIQRLEVVFQARSVASVRLEFVGEVRFDDDLLVELSEPVKWDEATYVLGRYSAAALPRLMPELPRAKLEE